MTNKEFYEIMNRLGMVEDGDLENFTSTDIFDTIEFIDNLFTYNDLETIKKLLLVFIVENSKNGK